LLYTVLSAEFNRWRVWRKRLRTRKTCITVYVCQCESMVYAVAILSIGKSDDVMQLNMI